ncbi:MAG: class IV adenylate cyclase [Anaerolineae bacterium]|jgi:adenylate cyclase class 2|nr:class IV adenylate cyclase [Anaerolineae bacterium]
MADKLIETEVKLFTPDLDAVRARLETAGAALDQARVHEHNIRYEDAGGTLTGRGIVLRLRRDRRARLTYKEPPSGGVSLSPGVWTRFEAEVTVDDLDTMDVILQRLGFHPHVVYEKYRTTYRLGDAEIVLDEMPYGDFIEVEGTPEAIESALAALGMQAEPRLLLSYMALFERVKAALGLDIHDLTFANFEGVDVPPEVFHLTDR